MQCCLELSYRWHDQDVIKLRAVAWNDRFGGAADLYVPRGELPITAALLKQFPKHVEDTASFVFGAFGSEWAGGATSVRLWCTDRAGHVGVEIKMEADFNGGIQTETVTLLSKTEPSDLDSFVAELQRLDRDCAGSATLILHGGLDS